MPEGEARRREEVLVADDPAGTAAERRHAHHIEDAVARGEADGLFRDLPGQGKPLEFRPEEGLATLDEGWLANHMLKNAGYEPAWAEVGRAVADARRRSAEAADIWRRAEGTARERAAAALTAAWEAENTAIRKWNRLAPLASMQRYPVPVERRWVRLGEAVAAEPARG